MRRGVGVRYGACSCCVPEHDGKKRGSGKKNNVLTYGIAQVAIDLTKPRGRVLGVDLIPVQPPKGVSTIQGNFLSPDIQAEIKSFLRDPDGGRLRQSPFLGIDPSSPTTENLDQMSVEAAETGYLERQHPSSSSGKEGEELVTEKGNDEHSDRTVDVVLSDMCEPWDPLDGLYKRTISNPYRRLMNTSGNAFRDHAGSMVCTSPPHTDMHMNDHG